MIISFHTKSYDIYFQVLPIKALTWFFNICIGYFDHFKTASGVFGMLFMYNCLNENFSINLHNEVQLLGNGLNTRSELQICINLSLI